MTNSVAKNLHIESQIAASLNSEHIPLHLFSVRQTCLVFNAGNISVFIQHEAKLGLCEKLLARMLKTTLSLFKVQIC